LLIGFHINGYHIKWYKITIELSIQIIGWEMNKELVVVGIAVLLICVGLSGCIEINRYQKLPFG